MEGKEKKRKNPFTIILILTGLMFLPFLAFLFDKLLLKLDNSILFVAEVSIVSLGILSGVLIYYFFFKN
ncbi:MAG: hypothetical protein GXO45_04700 [Aquificae bacterium]|nr:hypothetical protein [Aquificota bacterium]